MANQLSLSEMSMPEIAEEEKSPTQKGIKFVSVEPTQTIVQQSTPEVSLKDNIQLSSNMHSMKKGAAKPHSISVENLRASQGSSLMTNQETNANENSSIRESSQPDIHYEDQQAANYISNTHRDPSPLDDNDTILEESVTEIRAAVTSRGRVAKSQEDFRSKSPGRSPRDDKDYEMLYLLQNLREKKARGLLSELDKKLLLKI